jgi:predicted dehydrogenase
MNPRHEKAAQRIRALIEEGRIVAALERPSNVQRAQHPG